MIHNNLSHRPPLAYSLTLLITPICSILAQKNYQQLSLGGWTTLTNVFSCWFSCGFAKKKWKQMVHVLFLFIADLFGTYQGMLNLESTIFMNLEWFHFLWQVVQNHNFAKSREKPHKMQIFNEEVRSPTSNFWRFFFARMVPYGSNINVPGFPRFLFGKVAFLKQSSVHAFTMIMV